MLARLADECEISIHAPRMGSDAIEVKRISNGYISIHAPRMGSDILRLLQHAD